MPFLTNCDVKPKYNEPSFLEKFLHIEMQPDIKRSQPIPFRAGKRPHNLKFLHSLPFRKLYSGVFCRRMFSQYFECSLFRNLQKLENPLRHFQFVGIHELQNTYKEARYQLTKRRLFTTEMCTKHSFFVRLQSDFFFNFCFKYF